MNCQISSVSVKPLFRRFIEPLMRNINTINNIVFVGIITMLSACVYYLACSAKMVPNFTKLTYEEI